MAPEFALFLSPDGIALAHRQPAGHWAVLADTALDVPDLPAALAQMRQRGEDRAGSGFATLVILPDDQILFTSLTAPGPDDADRLAQIQDGLDGLTPYGVSDLAYDFVPLEDGRVKLAVVARETLAEAEGFARENGFEPAGFAARPLDNRYPGVAHFDRSPDWTASISDIEFGHDSWQQAPAPAEAPSERDTAPGEDASGAPEPKPDDAAPEDAPSPEGAGSSAPASAANDGLQEEAPVSADSEPDIAPAEDPAPAAAAGPDDASAPVTDETPSTHGPNDAPGQQRSAEDDAPLQIPTGFGAGRALGSPETAAERVGSRPSRLAIGATDEPSSSPDPAQHPARDGTLSPARPRFGRGHTKPADPPPDPAPTRPEAAGPVPDLPPLTRSKLRALRKKGQDKTAPVPPKRPALAAAPGDAAAGGASASDDAQTMRARLSGMGKRLSAGTERARDKAAGLSARRKNRAADVPGPDGSAAGIGSITARLKTLGRATRPGHQAQGGAADSALDARAVEEPARTGITPDEIAPPPARKPRLATPKRRRAAPAPTSPTDADTTLSGGLLGREGYAGDRGPSLRAGLILTLILLAVLGLIAIWAVFYLPDTALARWLGMGRQDAVVEQVDGAPRVSDAPQAPVSPPQAVDGGPAVVNLTPEATAPQAAATQPQQPDLLPDIDADLDLGPAPVAVPRVDPETLLPSVAEAEDFYARTGIWQRPPVIELPVPETELGGVLLAGLDPPVISLDAYALPVPSVNPSADLPRRHTSPVAPETEFVFDDNGLVLPSPEGTLNPDGILVFAGAPVLTPPRRPGDAPAAAEPGPDAPGAEADPTAGAIDTALLDARRPAGRPTDLQEQRERTLLGGITYAELGQIRPEGRPASVQETAAAAAEAAHSAADAEAAVAEITTTSEMAVAVSFVPRARPGNIGVLVETARAAAGSTAGGGNQATPVVARPSDTVQPEIPSSASVTRAATRENAINLHRINLIGVTGADSDRRALVRLPSGRFLTVGAGDQLDGGRVAAIGQTTLQYVKSGRTLTLEVPSG